ncbi:hypothetical protein [Rhodopseudomonas sp. B29]|uniref:hypothetical protein n=1 Tax=Rhodopseudomonas sp. B29 TaxID=95607 RepID=UPI0003452AA9|nr:hypothetical protein [Rhodopseudomonas sp. B29]
MLGGVLHDCNFFLTDDRMITVTVGGRRRSEMLGGAPPRALATTIAIELLHERPVTAPANELITHQERRTWLDRLFGRSIEHSTPHPGEITHQGLN